MTFRRLLLASAVAVLAPLGVITLVQAQSTGHQPDAKRGAVIAAQGTAAGAPPCAQCHAFNGVSDGSGAFPRLAGQSTYYLAGQLRDFASGVRASALMSPIAKALARTEQRRRPPHPPVASATGPSLSPASGRRGAKAGSLIGSWRAG